MLAPAAAIPQNSPHRTCLSKNLSSARSFGSPIFPPNRPTLTFTSNLGDLTRNTVGLLLCWRWASTMTSLWSMSPKGRVRAKSLNTLELRLVRVIEPRCIVMRNVRMKYVLASPLLLSRELRDSMIYHRRTVGVYMYLYLVTRVCLPSTFFFEG